MNATPEDVAKARAFAVKAAKEYYRAARGFARNEAHERYWMAWQRYLEMDYELFEREMRE